MNDLPGGRPRLHQPASGYDLAMAALGVGDREGAVAGLVQGFARHEILNDDASPGCNPVFDPLHGLASYGALMKRYGTLDEQVAAICFLASDEASYITGTVLPVAGGDLG